jgi:hypothetical protein
MTRRKRPFTVERRRIPKRPASEPASPPAAGKPDAEPIILRPIAQEVAFALREAPIRFPREWINAP